MIPDNIREKILQIVKDFSQKDGWAKQATVCLNCKRQDIDLKAIGGPQRVFSELTEWIEKDVDSHNLPILRLKKVEPQVVEPMVAEPKPYEIRNAYRKDAKSPEEWVSIRQLMEEVSWKNSPTQFINKYKLQYNPEYKAVRVHNISKYEIVDDIYFDSRNNFPSSIEALKEMALEEHWEDNLLENYISYTYAQVKDQNKITVSEDQLHACWNTGLVDYRYEPIYCYLTRNNADNRWKFKAFCIVGEDQGKIMNNNISVLPTSAVYFGENNLLCQPTESNLSVDRDHIIREHPSRLPINWLRQVLGEAAEWLEGERPFDYDRRISELLPKESSSNLYLQTMLKQSIDESIKRCQWNYKTAIPYYDPTQKQLGWFLPLCIRTSIAGAGSERLSLTPFAALVVSKGKSGRFQGETIYRLSWAYKCARLVCRPDSDWLTPLFSSDEENNSDD